MTHYDATWVVHYLCSLVGENLFSSAVTRYTNFITFTDLRLNVH